MKKTIVILLCAIMLLAASYSFGSGFIKCKDIYIADYKVSDDGTKMTITVGVGSSAGYIRAVSVHSQENGKICLDFLSAFGGINGSIGAKSVYTISLEPDAQTIALYRTNGNYEAALEKDEHGEWQRTK